MGLFWFGALMGAVTMFFTMILVFAQAVDEKDRQIQYLRERLAEQARIQSDEY